MTNMIRHDVACTCTCQSKIQDRTVSIQILCAHMQDHSEACTRTDTDHGTLNTAAYAPTQRAHIQCSETQIKNNRCCTNDCHKNTQSNKSVEIKRHVTLHVCATYTGCNVSRSCPAYILQRCTSLLTLYFNTHTIARASACMPD